MVTSGLVLNMTCQSGKFIIDLTQDFSTDKYVNALRKQFEKAGIDLVVSDEIIFETPFDELSEIITSPADTGEQVRECLARLRRIIVPQAQTHKNHGCSPIFLNKSLYHIHCSFSLYMIRFSASETDLKKSQITYSTRCRTLGRGHRSQDLLRRTARCTQPVPARTGRC